MQDEQFLAEFRAGTLEPFHHQDHVKMAWLYLQKTSLLQAVADFTQDLKHFAEVKGSPGLYHETITWAYMFLIHERMTREQGQSWEDFSNANDDLLSWENNILKQYYHTETLQSELARKVFIFPDCYCATDDSLKLPRNQS